MYVILTSKIGQFTTEPADINFLRPVEAYDYYFCGSKKARFVIAERFGEGKLKITEEAPPQIVNLISSRFLPNYETLELARAELDKLAGTRRLDTKLLKI